MLHQITIDITRPTVPILVETKKRTQRTSRASQEEIEQNPLREEATTEAETQTEVSVQKLEKQVEDTYMKLKNVIKTSKKNADNFQAGKIKFFLENW